jgi:hypothetical protein
LSGDAVKIRPLLARKPSVSVSAIGDTFLLSYSIFLGMISNEFETTAWHWKD